MSDQKPSRPESPLSNPQVVVTMIGGIVTVIAAIVGIVPAILTAQNATPIVVTSTPIPTSTVVATNVPPTNTLAASPVIATEAVQLTDVGAVQPTALPIPELIVSQAATAPSLPETGSQTASPNVLLMYDGVSFTMLNQAGRTLSFEGVYFRSNNGASWEARRWGPSVYNAVPLGKCLRLRDASVGQRNPPAPCVNNIFGLQEVGSTALFWVGVPTFEVVRNEQVIATCTVSDEQCSIAIP